MVRFTEIDDFSQQIRYNNNVWGFQVQMNNLITHKKPKSTYNVSNQENFTPKWQHLT
jgi:hypothetical protein